MKEGTVIFFLPLFIYVEFKIIHFSLLPTLLLYFFHFVRSTYIPYNKKETLKLILF